MWCQNLFLEILHFVIGSFSFAYDLWYGSLNVCIHIVGIWMWRYSNEIVGMQNSCYAKWLVPNFAYSIMLWVLTTWWWYSKFVGTLLDLWVLNGAYLSLSLKHAVDTILLRCIACAISMHLWHQSVILPVRVTLQGDLT